MQMLPRSLWQPSLVSGKSWRRYSRLALATGLIGSGLLVESLRASPIKPSQPADAPAPAPKSPEPPPSDPLFKTPDSPPPPEMQKPADSTMPPATGAEKSTSPDSPPPVSSAQRDAKVTKLLEYLEKDAYGKKLTTPFWVSRAMAVTSLSRLPQASIIPTMLDLLEKDKHDVVRLLAWQTILSRAGELDAKTHQRWMTATMTLAEKGAFGGTLRIAMLDALATVPPSPKAKKIWQQCFLECNAWEPQDVAVLNALGRTLAAWHSAQLAEAMVLAMTDANACVRAEYVLHAAGCTAPTAKEVLPKEVFDPRSQTRKHPASADLWKETQKGAAAWLNTNRTTWKELTKVEGEPWKKLQPLYIAAPIARTSIDPDDKQFTADLELTRADIDQFEAVFVVDATGSMGDVLAWLRRDMARVMSAFNFLSKEPPRIGVVFYRDRDQGDSFVTKILPMTFRLGELAPGLMQMTAEGGGDIPEAILDGLLDATEKMSWARSKRVGKVMILVGDAPPKPGTEEKCNLVAKKAFESGIRTYACKITTVDGRNDLTTFDAIAKAGGGSTVDAAFAPISNVRFLTPDGSKIQPIQTVARPEAQTIVAPPTAADSPGEKILVHILSDLINPQYKDRVEPLARTLVAHVQTRSEPEKRLVYAANTPPLTAMNFNAQKK